MVHEGFGNSGWGSLGSFVTGICWSSWQDQGRVGFMVVVTVLDLEVQGMHLILIAHILIVAVA